MNAIHALLDGTPVWDTTTIRLIARILRLTGRSASAYVRGIGIDNARPLFDSRQEQTRVAGSAEGA